MDNDSVVTPVTEATYRARLDEAAALPDGWDADGEAPPPTAQEIAMARDLWPSLVAMGLDRCLDAEDVDVDAMGGVSLTFRSPADYRRSAWLTLRENRGTRQTLVTDHSMDIGTSKAHGGTVDELLRIASQWVGAEGKS